MRIVANDIVGDDNALKNQQRDEMTMDTMTYLSKISNKWRNVKNHEMDF